jgi:toluene monooxygenase system protein E
VLKPLIDELFMKCLSDLALREDDYLLGQIFYSLNEDCRWHRQWSECLVRMAIEDNVRNADTIHAWINQWYPLAARAVHTFASLLEESSERNQTPPPHQIGEAINGYYHDYLRSMNLKLAA